MYSLSMRFVFLIPNTLVNGVHFVYELADSLSVSHDVLIISFDKVEILNYPVKTKIKELVNSKDDIKNADVIIGYGALCLFYINDLKLKVKKFGLVLNDDRNLYIKELFMNKSLKLNKHQIEVEYNNQQQYINASYNLPINYLVANKQLLKAVNQNSKSYVIPFNINHDLFYKDDFFLKDKIRIIFEDSNVVWKGTDLIKKAIEKLTNIQIWTFGNKTQTTKSDKHWSNVDSNQLRQIMSSCDIFIKAYREDGVADLEAIAMACGCAVITKETSGSKEFCLDGFNCVSINESLFEPFEYDDNVFVEMLTDNIKRLISDDKFRNSLITNGFETSKNSNWNISAKILESILKGKYVTRK